MRKLFSTPHGARAGAWLARAAALWAAACGGAPEPAPEAAPDLSGRLRWATAEASPIVPIGALVAEVVPLPGGLHRIGPGVDGRLVAWLVSPGDAVTAGQPLASLQSVTLTDRGSRVTELEAAVGAAAAQLELARAARGAGVGTAQEEAAASAAWSAAEAGLRAARSGLRASRDTARAAEGGWVWAAPVGGVVSSLGCPLGQVSAADACVELVSGSGGVVDVGAPERLVARIDAAETLTGAWVGVSGETAELQLLSRAPSLDAHSRQLRLRFTAPEGARAGATGRLTLQVPASPGLSRVPAAALSRLGGQDVVFVRSAAGQPERGAAVAAAPGVRVVAVQRLGLVGGSAVIDGVSPGDSVAVGGVFLLKSLAASGGEE